MTKSPGKFAPGPWTCAVVIAFAITLGLLADGMADGIAAILLLVPSVLVFRHLLARA